MSLEAPPDLEFGTFRIDREQRLLFSGTEIVPLAPKTFDTLLALVEGQGRIVEKDALLKRVWPDTFVEEGSLARNVSILRKTLGRGDDDQTYIETVPKRGYRFVANVKPVSPVVTPLERPEPRVVSLHETKRPRALLVAAVTVGVVIAGWGGWFWSKTTNPRPSGVMRLGFTLPSSEPFEVYNGSPITSVAIASDGSFVVYGAFSTATGKSHLYLRRLDQFDAQLVPGSEGGFSPFIAPNGSAIGFFTNDSLKRVDRSGARSETLAMVRGDGYGAEWQDDGTIIFDSGHGLARIASTGGTPQALTTVDEAGGEVHHLWPHLLPGGTDLLFTVQTVSPQGVEARIDTVTLASGRRRTILGNAAHARYLPGTGHLIYSSGGSILGVPFDAGKGAIAGQPVKLLDDVAATKDSAHLSVSRDGTLAYIRGRPVELRRSLVVVDRSGNATTLPAPPRAYQGPRVSADGQHALVYLWESGRSDVWTFDFVRHGLTRLTSSGTATLPVWSADGRSAVYQDYRDGPSNVVVQSIDGSTSARKVSPSAQEQWPHSFSPDGRHVIYTQGDPGPRHGNVWAAAIDGEPAPHALLPQQSHEQWGGWPSSDGRWLAYVSDETGQFEVYITDLPRLARKWQVSTNGGHEPVWSKTGGELFYREGNRVLSVSVGAAPQSRPGKPIALFEGAYVACCPGLPQYDTMPDGGFLMIRDDTDETVFTELRVVKGWASELNVMLRGAR